MEADKKAAGSKHQICKRKTGNLRCNNVIIGDDKLDYCENHYKQFTDLLNKEKKKPPPPDEHRCCTTNGAWRCKNLRCYLVGADGVPSKLCGKHYSVFFTNLLPPDEERCCNTNGMWRCKRSRMMMINVSSSSSSVPASRYCEKHYKVFKDDEQRCCANNGENWRCKNFRMKVGAGDEDSSDPSTKFCEKHYKVFIDVEKEAKDLPPDEERCCQKNDTLHWRCKNFRMMMNVGAGGDNEIKLCQQHYFNYLESKWKKRSRYGEGCTTPDSKRRKKDDGTGIQPSRTTRDLSKRRNTVTGDDRSIGETRIQAESTNDACGSDKIIQGGSVDIGMKRKIVERTESHGELESRIREPMVELESLEHYKSKCIELSAELEKKKVECTKLQGELADVQTRKTADTDETERSPEDAIECWRKMFSDLESRVQRMEDANSTLAASVESRISNLESLVLRSAEKSSQLKCAELQNSEKNNFEASENNRSKTNAEIRSGGRKDSNLSKANKLDESESEFPKHSAMNISSGSLNLNLESIVLKSSKESSILRCVELQNDVTQSGEKEMTEKPFLNLVSDDDSDSFVNLVSDDDGESSGESGAEDSDTSTDSGGSLGEFMEMMAMKYRNENKEEEIKWKCEADMVSSFEEDPELCMKAVCALYRKKISGDEASTNGLFHYADSDRGTTLAKFLMDGACQGDLKKSVKELEIFDPEAVEDCKRLARSYSIQLFSIYQNGKDPFFLPDTSAK